MTSALLWCCKKNDVSLTWPMNTSHGNHSNTFCSADTTNQYHTTKSHLRHSRCLPMRTQSPDALPGYTSLLQLKGQGSRSPSPTHPVCLHPRLSCCCPTIPLSHRSSLASGYGLQKVKHQGHRGRFHWYNDSHETPTQNVVELLMCHKI